MPEARRSRTGLAARTERIDLTERIDRAAFATSGCPCLTATTLVDERYAMRVDYVNGVPLCLLGPPAPYDILPGVAPPERRCRPRAM